MGRLRFGSGSVSIELDDTLDRMARAAVDRVHPGLLDRMEADTEAVLDDVRKEWPKGRRRRPVRKHSRDLFEMQSRISADKGVITTTITNSAPYAKYVKPVKLWGKSGYVVYLRNPLRKRQRALVKDLADLIAGRLFGRL